MPREDPEEFTKRDPVLVSVSLCNAEWIPLLEIYKSVDHVHQSNLHLFGFS